jgi:hypothetical protein
VQCRDGQDQPDGNAYPDSENISLNADLLLPRHRDIYPLHLELEVVGPGGTTWRTLHETIENTEAERATVSFQFDQIATLLNCPGMWMVRLTLRNMRKVLAVTTLRSFVITSFEQVLASLKVESFEIVGIRHSGRPAPVCRSR